ncbi:MAG: acyl transferase [Saprospiraceae bacterium]|nr:acyl transferase [Saprospiraceae bacterium]
MQTAEHLELLSKLADLSPGGFEETALAVFRYQARHNPVLARYLHLLGRDPASVQALAQIPFLPIGLFKNHVVQSGDWTPETEFTSSGTTGQAPSRHRVRHLQAYLDNTRRGFAHFYGDPADWCTLALLPSYLEREGSSLVAMADFFIRASKYPESGFFLHDFENLRDTLLHCRAQGIPTLLLGVSFGLLDFAERYPMDLRGVVVMETGGMKGRRKELTRSELHRVLGQAFQLPGLHSEYGMTELLSQAYSQPDPGGAAVVFVPAPRLRVLATEINDPFCVQPPGRPGLLNMVDLANLDTCSFIATEDVGKVYADGRFEVLGRLDVAELRGCNLMVE